MFKKVWLMLVLSLVFSIVSVTAACTDSDNTDVLKVKDSLSVKGTTKSGTVSRDDTCVQKKLGAEIKEGVWIKEFYCADDKVEPREVACSSFGFAGCNDGACFGKAAARTISTGMVTASGCGNKKVDSGEECDPPDKLCVTADGDPGICLGTCKCRAVEVPAAGSKSETTEKVSSSKPSASVAKETQTAASVPSKSKTSVPLPEVEAQRPGFFKRIWLWITGLFS